MITTCKLTTDGIRAPAATFYGILDADCAQTEIAHSAREAVLERKLAAGPETASCALYRFSVWAHFSTETDPKYLAKR